jgi:hypothetical protein
LQVKMLRTQRNNPHEEWLGHYILVMFQTSEELGAHSHLFILKHRCLSICLKCYGE